MTPSDLETQLAKFPADAALVFETNEGPIGAGYHVTEWKLARVESIDCGGQRDSWSEARLQLLDGPRGTHLKVGKFRAILAKSVEAMPTLGQSPLYVEFAHGNAQMKVFEAGSPAPRDGSIHLPLHGATATCKPAKRFTRTAATPATQSCCG